MYVLSSSFHTLDVQPYLNRWIDQFIVEKPVRKQ